MYKIYKKITTMASVKNSSLTATGGGRTVWCLLPKSLLKEPSLSNPSGCLLKSSIPRVFFTCPDSELVPCSLTPRAFVENYLLRHGSNVQQPCQLALTRGWPKSLRGITGKRYSQGLWKASTHSQDSMCRDMHMPEKDQRRT